MGENKFWENFMNTNEIIKDWLKSHGYDGLYNEEFECGCGLNDLGPCEVIGSKCVAGYRWKDGTYMDKPETSNSKLIAENECLDGYTHIEVKSIFDFNKMSAYGYSLDSFIMKPEKVFVVYDKPSTTIDLRCIAGEASLIWSEDGIDADIRVLDTPCSNIFKIGMNHLLTYEMCIFAQLDGNKVVGARLNHICVSSKQHDTSLDLIRARY